MTQVDEDARGGPDDPPAPDTEGEAAQPAGENVSLAKQLSRQTGQNRTAVNEDGDGQSVVHPSNLPGASALGTIQHLTPFLFFFRVYANVLYANGRRKTPELRMAKFKQDYPGIFWLHWVLDFVLQLFLVLAIVVGIGIIVFNGILRTFNLG